MNKFSLNKIAPLIFFCLTLFMMGQSAIAAIPMKEKVQKEKGLQVLNSRENAKTMAISQHENEQEMQNPADTDHEDSGIYGILSLVSAVLGIFPAAIVLGIIGCGKNRKLQGLAIAGLVVGTIQLASLVLVLAILFFLL